MRFFKYPKWLKGLYPGAIWDISFSTQKTLYLTFDDGPNPLTTGRILQILEQYQAKASFFCLGKNAEQHPELIAAIQQAGHRVANHGMNHINGYHVKTAVYLEDVLNAEKVIPGKLFRPAYGRIKPKQFKKIRKLGYTIYFWGILSYDFDSTLPSEVRLNKIRKHTKPGSILVFHDSLKAIQNLEAELPQLLDEWTKAGYTFKALP